MNALREAADAAYLTVSICFLYNMIYMCKEYMLERALSNCASTCIHSLLLFISLLLSVVIHVAQLVEHHAEGIKVWLQFLLKR